ncbi:hypothetical protein PsAD13_01965 [Pseudovibrio sp. Ad13]|nr:hypothetical protein PsAD13_01965 [Pseudovibrio sp. Ad13]
MEDENKASLVGLSSVLCKAFRHSEQDSLVIGVEGRQDLGGLLNLRKYCFAGDDVTRTNSKGFIKCNKVGSHCLFTFQQLENV